MVFTSAENVLARKFRDVCWILFAAANAPTQLTGSSVSDSASVRCPKVDSLVSSQGHEKKPMSQQTASVCSQNVDSQVSSRRLDKLQRPCLHLSVV